MMERAKFNSVQVQVSIDKEKINCIRDPAQLETYLEEHLPLRQHQSQLNSKSWHKVENQNLNLS